MKNMLLSLLVSASLVCPAVYAAGEELVQGEQLAAQGEPQLDTETHAMTKTDKRKMQEENKEKMMKEKDANKEGMMDGTDGKDGKDGKMMHKKRHHKKHKKDCD